MANFNFKIVATLLLIFGTSSALAEGRSCHALFEQVRPTEEQIDIAIRELYELKNQMYKEHGLGLLISKKEFNQKFDELAQHLSLSEIKNKMSLIQLKTQNDEKTNIVPSKAVDDIIEQIATAQAFLLKNGFRDVNSTINGPQSGYTTKSPLILAIDKKELQLVELLIELGADINMKVGNGKVTALSKAVYLGDLETIKILVKHGADIKTRIFSDSTNLLLYAVENKKTEEVITYLLNSGLDPNEKNSSNQTTLSLAEKNLKELNQTIKYTSPANRDAIRRHKRIIKLLKQYGAKE